MGLKLSHDAFMGLGNFGLKSDQNGIETASVEDWFRQAFIVKIRPKWD